MRTPFLVVGTQRSGTTLLFRMLDSHPEFAGINEFWELHPYVAGKDANMQGLIQAIRGHLGIDLSSIAPGGCIPLVAAMFHELAEKRGKQTGFLKDPRLTYFLDDWIASFPESKYLFIVRDPRAVVSSYLEQGLCSNAFCGAELWEHETKLQERFRECHPESSWLVRYEDLIESPEEHLRQVCDFLGASFFREMMDYHQRPAHTAINKQNIETQKPIKLGNRDKWRSRLTSGQIRTIDSTLANAMERFGYQPDSATKPLHAIHRKMLRSHNWFSQELRWQRQSGWNGVRRRLPSWFPGSTKAIDQSA